MENSFESKTKIENNDIFQDAIEALFEDNMTIDTHVYHEDADKELYPLEETEDGSLILNLNIEELPLPYFENYHKHSSKNVISNTETQATSNDIPDQSQPIQDPENDSLSSLFPYYNDFLKDIAFENGEEVVDNNINIEKPIASNGILETQDIGNEADLTVYDEIYTFEGENDSVENIIDISDEFKDIMENLNFEGDNDQDEHILFPFDYVD